MIHRAAITVCRADCVLPSGESLRLLVSELSLGGAFIVSMKPAPLGTRIALMLLPDGHAPVGPIDARIIGLRLDPSNALKSGFELMFPDVDDSTFDALALLVARFEYKESLPPPRGTQRGTQRGQAEKRQFPRVRVSLAAHVQSEAGAFQAFVKNLSMTGAMFVIDTDPGSPSLLASNTKIKLTIISTEPPESMALDAEVMRTAQGTGGGGIGVRFLNVDELDARRLEGLMLHALLSMPIGSID